MVVLQDGVTVEKIVAFESIFVLRRKDIANTFLHPKLCDLSVVFIQLSASAYHVVVNVLTQLWLSQTTASTHKGAYTIMDCAFQDVGGGKHILGCETFNTIDGGEVVGDHDEGNTEYNLRNGRQESNREKATRSFLEKEFRPVIEGQDEAIFIPNCFIAQRPDLMGMDLYDCEQTEEQLLEI